jgi:two-component system cell cycle sensor histidine kinase/response regulator CckA
MGGLACLQALRANDPEIKVLVASGYASDEHALAACDRGAVGFLPKPYLVTDLLARIRAALDEPSPRGR